MKISLSQEKKGVIGLAGHVGCGHCHSHKLQIQDDSAGLAVILTLFKEATGLSLIIKKINIKTGIDGFFEVITEGGGKGRAAPRRGITPQEAELAETLIGKEAARTHALVIKAFGRYYGQGILETPVSLQTAIANAALGTFTESMPSHFIYGYEDLKGSCGMIAGAVLDFEGIPVSVLGTVNASEGGIGPNEDMEGNVAVGRKKMIMEGLGMINLPTIIVESKFYSPHYAQKISASSFLVRGDEKADNLHVAASIIKSAQALGFAVFRDSTALARVKGSMAEKVKGLGEKIEGLGAKLRSSEYAQEKIEILAELAVLVSQNGAGVSFMSNQLHDIVGGTGAMPGSGAVINYIVPEEYYKKQIYPVLTEEELLTYIKLIKQSVKELYNNLPQASDHLRNYNKRTSLDSLVLK